MNHAHTSLLFILTHVFFIVIFLLFSWKKKWLVLNHKSLLHQPLFWMAIFIPFISFLLYGFWSWWGHSPDLSAEGFEVFYTVSKVPLLILAASVPLASIVNNVHRTIQTEKQINEAEQKNRSDSYYNHFKHTLDLLNSIESEEMYLKSKMANFKLKITNPVSLYKDIFNNSSHSIGAIYQANNYFIDGIKKEWMEINKGLGKISYLLHERSNIEYSNYNIILFINIYRIERSFERLCETLHLNNNNHIHRPIFKLSMLQYTGLFYDSESLKAGIQELNKICLKIFDIIASNNSSIIIHQRYFLKQAVFVSYNRIPPDVHGSKVYVDRVLINLKQRRQNGGS